MKVWHAHTTSNLAKEKSPSRRHKQEVRTRGQSKKHAQAAHARVSSKSYKQEPRARSVSKLPSRVTSQSDNSAILDTWDTRRMHQTRGVQQPTQESATCISRSTQTKKINPKWLQKSSKIGLEIQLDGVLGTLLIQTSIKAAFQVDFFQIWGAQKAPFGTPRRAPGRFLSLPEIASLSRWIFASCWRPSWSQKLLQGASNWMENRTDNTWR